MDNTHLRKKPRAVEKTEVFLLEFMPILDLFPLTTHLWMERNCLILMVRFFLWVQLWNRVGSQRAETKLTGSS